MVGGEAGEREVMFEKEKVEEGRDVEVEVITEAMGVLLLLLLLLLFVVWMITGSRESRPE